MYIYRLLFAFISFPNEDILLAKILIWQKQYTQVLELLESNTDPKARYYAGWCYTKLGIKNAIAKYYVKQ